MKNLLLIVFIMINCLKAWALPEDHNHLESADRRDIQSFSPLEENSHMVWNGDPLVIKLALNQEKRIIFSTPVSVDLRGILTSDQLRIFNNDKSLYLTALKPFSTARAYVRLKESGEVVLVDLVTDEKASASSQYIDPKPTDIVPPQEQDKRGIAFDEPAETGQPENVTYVDLIRYAWQQVYAPDRLLAYLPQYARSPMHTRKFVPDLIYGDKVIAHPLSAWVSGNFYLTLVALQNKYPHHTQIKLDADLCGHWLAAAIYPDSHLKAHGNKEGDSALLLLVSSRPFGAVLGVCHGDA